MSQCSICLSNYKHPLCLPCGHIYCKTCLNDHVNSPGNPGLSAKCPDCRVTFHLVTPDLGHLPAKYHPFVVSPLRRVYINSNNGNQAALEKRVKELEQRLILKTAMEQSLMTRCEALSASLDAHRQGERDANERILDLEQEIFELEDAHNQHNQRIVELENIQQESLSETRKLKAKLAKSRAARDQSEREKRELEAELSLHGGVIDSSDYEQLAIPPPVRDRESRSSTHNILRIKEEPTSQTVGRLVPLSSPPAWVPATPSASASAPVRPTKPLPKRRREEAHTRMVENRDENPALFTRYKSKRARHGNFAPEGSIFQM
ncbi:hypothetical protein CPB83DRAFT_850696 [Crepidotus variabilis]|uniref:RING-type domain-containing protein n=1 Tax=Crepidotus variabilis TaxID=179855 RepID=A0A9P6JS93_9AGAR|nr:hypothetical protein CPB83DRAFT_850696 [Crepidotus variabilis]